MIKPCRVCRNAKKNDRPAVVRLPSGRFIRLCSKCVGDRFMADEAERRAREDELAGVVP